MGILATIFGSGEVIKKGLELIDDMHTSDEEAIKAKTEGKVALLNAYAPFKIAQRYLAVLFSVTFLSCFVGSLVCTVMGIGDPEAIKTMVNEWWIGEIMLAIIGFYFGGGFLESKTKK